MSTLDGPASILPITYPYEPAMLASPAVTNEWLDQIHRDFDAFFWRRMMDTLEATARSGERGYARNRDRHGKLDKRVAAEMARTIRNGLQGILPTSWVPLALKGATGTNGRIGFPPPARAIAYALAAPSGSAPHGKSPYLRATRRGYISDRAPRQTIVRLWNIHYDTYKRWYQDPYNVELAELILDFVALDHIRDLTSPRVDELFRWRLLGVEPEGGAFRS